MIVDEADSLLQSAADIYASPEVGRYDKSELNSLLDSTDVATIWISNAYRAIPDSALRRFGHVLAFPEPSLATRSRILSDCLRSDDVPSAIPIEIAAKYRFTPAAAQRAVSIALYDEADRPMGKAERLRDYFQRAARSPVNPDIAKLPTVNIRFDPALSCANIPADDLKCLVRGRIDAGRGMRLLFSGPPGGGKTEMAKWLAAAVDRECLVRRPSDLLSMFVGESEQQIAAAFRTAEQLGAILVFDEADALMYERSTAVRSWEQSQVAEFLQQIQEFDGILIACTNRFDAMDPAIRRRFHRHIELGYLDPKLIEAAIHHMFPDVVFGPDHIARLTSGPPLMMSDLANAAETIEVHDAPGVTTDTVLAAILDAAKARSPGRPIGF